MTRESANADVHSMIRKSIGELTDDYDWGYWLDHIRNGTFPVEFWDDMADNGWFGVYIQEEYGGEGLGLEEMMVVNEELLRGGAKAKLLVILVSIFGPMPLLRHGTDEQKE